MAKKYKILLTIGAVFLAMAAFCWPYASHSIALYWARRSAHRTFDKLAPEAREALNLTPVSVELPRVTDGEPRESASLGKYLIQFPRPVTSTKDADRGTEFILLRYSQFQVRIVQPSLNDSENSSAHELQFKDAFDMYSTASHTRLDDLDHQPDLPSLRRFAQIIELKMILPTFCEQFEADDKRGFVIDRTHGTKRQLADVFVPRLDADCIIVFDEGDFALVDVNRYLSQIRFSTIPPTTSPAAH